MKLIQNERMESRQWENKRQPSLDNNRHWEAFCKNKDDKKVLSGQPLESTAKTKTQVVLPKTVQADDYSAILSLVPCFDELEDPRINRRRVHNLIDMIVIAICAVICNADEWADMRTWAESHRQWLQQFLELPGGLPSRDTLRRRNRNWCHPQIAIGATDHLFIATNFALQKFLILPTMGGINCVFASIAYSWTLCVKQK